MGTIATLAINIIGNVQGLDAALSKAQKSLRSAGDSLTGIGSKMSLGITAPIVGIGTMAVMSAGEFEQSMNIMAQVSGATADQMAQLQQQALDLGASTSFSAGEAAQAQLELAKAGLKPMEIFAAMPGVLDMAAAGGMGVAQSAEIAANAVNTFGLEASSTTEIANTLAAAANASSVDITDLAQGMTMAGSVFASAGQSINDLTIAMALLGNNGIKGSDAGTSLKTALMRLTAPTDEAAGALADLGVNVFDAQGKMREFPAILADLQQGLYGTNAVTVTSSNLTAEQAQRMEYLKGTITKTQTQLANYASGIAGVAQSENDKIVAQDRLNRTLAAAQTEYAQLAAIGGTTSTVMKTLTEEQRQQALSTIFGADAIRSISVLMSEGTEGWNEMAGALGVAGAATDVANARMKGISGAVEYFKGSVDSFLIGAALPFLDFLGNLIRMAADAITWVGQLPEPVRNMAIGVAAVAAAIGPALVGLGMFLKFVAFLTPAVSVLGAALGVIVSPLGLVAAGLAALVAFDVGGIRTLLGDLANYFMEVAVGGDYLNDWLTHLPEAIQPAVLALGQFMAALGGLIQTGDVNAFVAELKVAFPDAAAAVEQAIATINSAVAATVTAFGEAQTAVNTFLATDTWTTAQESIAGSLGAIGEAFASLFSGDVSLSELKDTLLAQFGEIGTALGELFVSEEFTQLGSSLAAAFGLDTLAADITAKLEPVKTAFQPLIDFLEPSFTRLKETVTGLPEQFGALGEKFGPLKESATQLATAIAGMFGGGGEAGGMQISILGAVLAGSLSLLTNTINALVGALAPLAGAMLDQITTLMGGLATVVSGLHTAFEGIVNNNPTQVLQGLQQVLQGWSDILTGTLTNSMTALQVALEAIGTVITTTLVDWGFDEAATSVQAVLDTVNLLIEQIKKLVSGDTSLNFAAPEWITNLLAWVWPSLSLPEVIDTLLAWVWPSLELPDLLDTLLSWDWPGFPSVPSWISRLLDWEWPDFDMPDWLNRLFSWSWPTLPQLPAWLGGPSEEQKAVGTSYFGGGFVNASEVATEVAILPRGRNWLPRGAQILNGRDTAALVGGGGGVTVVVQNANIRNERDIRRWAYEIDDIQQRRRRM